MNAITRFWPARRTDPDYIPLADELVDSFDAFVDADFTISPVELARTQIASAVSYHEAEIAAQLAAKVARAETLQEATARVRAKDAEADELIRQHKEALALYQPKPLLSDPLQKPKAKGRG